ncbi:MAG TPA: AI-2E family transporter [Candidatus Acidoferrum sp.]|jgi:predicted PurR-regulated permease PerM
MFKKSERSDAAEAAKSNLYDSGLLTRPDDDKIPPRLIARVGDLLWIIVLAIGIAFCFFASSFCITLLLAAFFSILFDPVITHLERWLIPRPVSAALGIFLGMACVAFLIYAGYGKVTSFAEDLPQYTTRIRDTLKPISQKIQKVQESAGSLNPANAGTAPKKVPVVRLNEEPTWPSYLVRGVGSVWGAIIIGGVVPFLMFFMLVRKDHLSLWAANAFGDRVNVDQFSARLNGMVRGFVFGNLMVGSLLALVSVGAFYAIHMHGAVAVGIASGLLNLVPFVGLILAAVLPLLAATLQFGSAGPFVIIVLTVLILHLIANNLLIPHLIGSRINIGPVAATVGMLFWGWLWGVMGLLLAVPLTAFVKLVADCHPSLIHVSNLLAQKPRPLPRWAVSSQATIIRAIPYFRPKVTTKAKSEE